MADVLDCFEHRGLPVVLTAQPVMRRLTQWEGQLNIYTAVFSLWFLYKEDVWFNMKIKQAKSDKSIAEY